MQMTLRQIEAFLMVADMRSFTAAGTALHITQSAVSNLIKDLEGQVGVPLFDRTSRFVSLSPDGREFYGLAQKAFHEFLLMEKYAGELCSLRAGRVRIVGAPRMAVNSAHHQAVATAGSGIVNALAPDGVVEGVEHPGHRFALGVQWHPEYAVDPRDPAIFTAFVEAAR